MAADTLAKPRQPKDTRFLQQDKKVLHPLLTPMRTIVLFMVVGIAFIPIGASIISAADGVIEVESDDYSVSCCVENCGSTTNAHADNLNRVDRNPCNVTITVSETMKAPVYMYYAIDNFYQNHRDYVKSRCDAQLAARLDAYARDKILTKFERECDLQVYVRQNNSDAYDQSWQGVIYPCGLVAWSVFNDSLSLLDANGVPVPGVSESDISWKSDRELKFKNDPEGNTGYNFAGFAYERSQICSNLPTTALQTACVAANLPAAGWCFPGSGYCIEDEHFIVWMRTAARPSFRKLFAKISIDLEPGTYIVSVSNGLQMVEGDPTFYNPSMSQPLVNGTTSTPYEQSFLWPAHSFGKKTVVLSTASWVGGKNGFLGYAYLVVGVVCIVLALAFAVKWQQNPRELGAWPADTAKKIVSQ